MAEADYGENRTPTWDHETHPQFYAYYAAESLSESTLQRFRSAQRAVLRVANATGLTGALEVADVGCGAGTQARSWAALGHRVRGVDVNAALIELARRRAAYDRLEIAFEVGSATELPWEDACVDVCLIPELLEHVADWRSCVSEAARILKPGGLLYISTTNYLCPRQQEFNLPLYSWYPAALKRYCERLSITTRPAIANYAKYPAVNWFSFYSLRDYLKPFGFRCLDRFDTVDLEHKGAAARQVVHAVRRMPYLRFLAHVATPSTVVIAVKDAHVVSNGARL